METKSKRLISVSATISGALISMGLFSFVSTAHATSLTFNFDAKFVSAGTLGDTSNLIDYSAGLVVGQIIHGSFSYDPSAASLFPPFISGGVTLASYFPISLAFSTPSANFSTAAAVARMNDAIVGPSTDHFSIESDISSLTLSGHTLDLLPTVAFDGPLTTFNSAALPTNFNLADFTVAALVVSQDELDASDNVVGLSTFRADLTSITVSSETPIPAALPLFASGLGAFGVLSWRRNRKAAALAA